MLRTGAVRKVDSSGAAGSNESLASVMTLSICKAGQCGQLGRHSLVTRKRA